MSDRRIEAKPQTRRIGRSVAALVAGFVVNVVLTLSTDSGLRAIGLFPALGQPMSDARLLLLATAYRALYGVASSYTTARFAPDRPMRHSMIGGGIGLVLSTIGAVATWNLGLGPHWYPLALVALAMPLAWIGGKLRVMQLHTEVLAHSTAVH